MNTDQNHVHPSSSVSQRLSKTNESLNRILQFVTGCNFPCPAPGLLFIMPRSIPVAVAGVNREAGQ